MIRLRGLARALLVTGVACVVALHVLRPDLGPAAHRLSEYATGPHAWLMAVAFATIGTGLVLVAAAVIRAGRPSGADAGVVGGLVAVAGIGLLVSGWFPTEPHADTAAELVHSRASALATVALSGAAVLDALRPQRRRARGRSDRWARRLAGTGAALLLVSPLLHDTAVAGLGQRLLWATLLAWALVRLPASSGPARRPARERRRDGRDKAPSRHRRRTRRGVRRG